MKKLIFILIVGSLFGQSENINSADFIITTNINQSENIDVNDNIEYFLRFGGLIISLGGATLAVNNSTDSNRFKGEEKRTIDTIGYSLISIGGLIIANTRSSNKHLNPPPLNEQENIN